MNADNPEIHLCLSHILSLDWHNRFLRNWELKISNLYYIHYLKNSFHYPLPITHYHALRSVTLQGAECGFICVHLWFFIHHPCICRKTCRITSAGTWSVTVTAPIWVGRTNRTLPASTFLSVCRVSRIASMSSTLGSLVGNPAF
jgi:hypothetical protein